MSSSGRWVVDDDGTFSNETKTWKEGGKGVDVLKKISTGSRMQRQKKNVICGVCEQNGIITGLHISFFWSFEFI
jgi:hypothetical protein